MKTATRAVNRRLAIKVVGKNIPVYQSEFAAGCDLQASLKKDVRIKPGAYELIPTGIRIEIPAGYEAQVRPRSGLAKNHGIGILNSPGTIDADYRGEIKVILFNFGPETVVINDRDRIAQLVFTRVERAELRPARRLNKTRRQARGFGSSGIGGSSRREESTE